MKAEENIKSYNFYPSSSTFIEDIEYYKEGVNYFSQLEDVDMTCKMLLGLGDSYLHSNKYKKARNSYNIARKLYKDEKNDRGEFEALNRIGDLYVENRDWSHALDYYIQAWNRIKKINDPQEEIDLSYKIGCIYEKEGSYDDSLKYYKESLRRGGKSETQKKYEEVKWKLSHLHPSTTQTLFLLILTIIIFLSEFLTTYGNMNLGLIIHSIVLIALIVGSGLSTSESFSNLLRSMIILPLIRIIGLSMPIMQIDPLYWFPIVSIPLFAVAFILMRSQGLTRESVGIIWDNVPVQALIPITGVITGIIEYFILRPEPLIASLNWINLAVGGIIIIISTGFAEELLYRGLIQKNAENVMGKYYALFFASLLFTALHMGWTSSLDLLFVFIVAMFYGYIFQKTRSIIGISFAHGISNILLFLVMPFLI